MTKRRRSGSVDLVLYWSVILLKNLDRSGVPWHHFAVLLEVKRDRSGGPNPADGTTLTGLAAQLAEMARIHLRPLDRL
jgi:hypothetical protein